MKGRRAKSLLINTKCWICYDLARLVVTDWVGLDVIVLSCRSTQQSEWFLVNEHHSNVKGIAFTRGPCVPSLPWQLMCKAKL